MKIYPLVVLLLSVTLPSIFSGMCPVVTDPVQPGGAKQVDADPDGNPLPPGAIARLGTERLRPAREIQTLAFSADGKLLASAGGTSGPVYLWDPATGKEVRRLGSAVRAMAMSPDGAYVAAACEDGDAPAGRPWAKACTLHLWEPATGKPIPWTPKPAGIVNTLAFSADGKTLATAEGKSVRLWEVPTGKEIRQLKGEQNAILSMAFSPDGKWLLTGAKDKSLCLWNVASGQLAHQIRTTSVVYTVAFSPLGDTFASAGGDGLGLWKAETGENIRWFKKPPDFVMAVAFSSDGKALVSSGPDKTARLWDVATGEELRRLTGAAGFQAVVFAPDGKAVAAGGWDQRIRLWDVATGQELHRTEGHSGIVWSLAFSPDGKTFASGGSDQVVRLWDLGTCKLLRRLEGNTGSIWALAYSPDGKTLASADGGKAVRLWEVDTGKVIRQFTSEHGTGFTRVAFSPDGKMLACGQSQAVQLWDIPTGKMVRDFAAHRGTPDRIFFTPGGETLIAACHGNTVYAWSVDTGTDRYQFESNEGFQSGVAVSADGRNLAAQGNDGIVHVWELATGKERAHFMQKELIWSLTFSADGRRLIGALSSNPLCVWDLETAREVGRLAGHSCLTRVLAFSPDGKVLASGASNGPVLLWDAGRLPEAKRALPRELSPQELEAEWQALVGQDAARAYQALGVLRGAPRLTLPLLKRDLRPAAAVDTERINRLLKELDDNEFAVREKATEDLEKLGGAAEDAARNALQADISAEVRMRLRQVLAKYQVSLVAGDRVRALRLLELLEQTDAPEARQMLKTLAENETDPWLSREAKAAAARLRDREGSRP